MAEEKDATWVPLSQSSRDEEEGRDLEDALKSASSPQDSSTRRDNIPKYGIFENINSMKELAQMPQWTPERPLRVATEFTCLGPNFLKENGLEHVTFSTVDGALEAAPAVPLVSVM